MASSAVLDRHRLTGDPDFALVGPVEAVQNAHQSGLAGAVLSDDPVNGAGLDREAHVPIGVDAAESLVDAAKLDRRRTELRRRTPRHLLGGRCPYFAGHSPSVT